MSLIDKTYFVKDINIPDSTYSDLTAYIATNEKAILIKLLGYEIWKLVDAYNAVTSPQRILDLVEGVEYDVDGYTIKWNGLKNTDLISLIAYYVYYLWLKDNTTFTTKSGELKSIGENAEIANPTVKMVNAWNKLRDLYGYSGQDSYEPSAYNFLLENEADYPEWLFSPIESTNVFGI